MSTGTSSCSDRRRAGFAVPDDVLERTPLSRFIDGELLALRYKNRTFRVANIDAIDMLDHDATIWDANPADDPLAAIDEPRFRLDRLGNSLFKIPETAISALYCWEAHDDPGESFRAFVREETLTGLLFTKLYSVPI